MTTVTAASLATSQASLSGQSATLSQDFDDFLHLLTTQLQNQDPLAPTDSTEFTNQIVQFSQVEQQINQNNKLDQMLALQLAGTSNVALGYVGLDVSYVGDLFYTDGEGEREIYYSLESQAVTSKVYIKDATTGDVVKTLDGATAEGNHKVVWDGTDDNGDPVEPGNYRVSADALDQDDQAVQTSTAVSGTVTGIETVNGVIQLLLEGDALVPVSSVISAKQGISQETQTTDTTTNTGGSDETDETTDENSTETS